MKREKRQEHTAPAFPAWLSAALAALYAALLIPLLYIGRYAAPAVDDFSFGESTHLAWNASHSLFAVLAAAAAKAAHEYVSWQGTFSSIFFFALEPGIFGERFYALTPWIMLGMLSVSTYCLVRCVLTRLFGADRNAARCAALMLLIVSVQCMPGANEALYWYCGAANFILMYSFGLLFAAAMVRAYCAPEGRGRVIWTCVCTVLAVICGGGNYMTCISLFLVLLFSFAWMAWRGQLKRRLYLLVPAAVFLAAFAANVLAPGNAERIGTVAGFSAPKSVLMSIYYFFDMCVSDWTTWPVIAALLLMVPLFWHIAGESAHDFPAPMVLFVLGAGVVSANVTPPIFAVGNIDAGRLKALFFLQYMLVMSLVLFCGTGWLRRRMEARGYRGPGAADKELRAVIAAGVLIVLFGAALSVRADRYFFTSSAAVEDIANGSAAAYGEALRERFDVLHDPAVREVEFDPLPAEPYLLYYSDLSGRPDSWENRACARYYDKESVAVRGRE